MIFKNKDTASTMPTKINKNQGITFCLSQINAATALVTKKQKCKRSERICVKIKNKKLSIRHLYKINIALSQQQYENRKQTKR